MPCRCRRLEGESGAQLAAGADARYAGAPQRQKTLGGPSVYVSPSLSVTRRAIAVVVIAVSTLPSCERGSDTKADEAGASPQVRQTCEPRGRAVTRTGQSRAPIEHFGRIGDPAALVEVGFDESDRGSCAFVGFVFEGGAPPHRVSYEDPPFTDCDSGRRLQPSQWGGAAYLVFASEQSRLQSPFNSDTDFRPSRRRDSILRHVRLLCSSGSELVWVVAIDRERRFGVSVRDIDRNVRGVYIEIAGS